MIYVVAFLLPPLATLLVGRIGATILNVILWMIIVAISVMIVVPTMGIGLVLMLLPIIHACAVVGSARQDKRFKKFEQRMQQHTEKVAETQTKAENQS